MSYPARAEGLGKYVYTYRLEKGFASTRMWEAAIPNSSAPTVWGSIYIKNKMSTVSNFFKLLLENICLVRGRSVDEYIFIRSALSARLWKLLQNGVGGQVRPKIASDSEALFLDIWGVWSTSSLELLKDPLEPGVGCLWCCKG